MTLLAFTPAKFSLLAAAAITVTLSASSLAKAPEKNRFVASDFYRQSDAVGEAAGLTSTYATDSFIPTPVPHMPERREVLLPTPQSPAPIVRRSYPPMER